MGVRVTRIFKGIFCASNTVASTIWREYLLVGVEDTSNFDESFAVLNQLAECISEEINLN